MALSEVEKKVLIKVVRGYLDRKAATRRRELNLEFEDPEVIDRLYRWQLLQTYDSDNYLPTPIAFHYCGDPEIQLLAKRSTAIVARVFSKLYRQ